MPQWPQKIWFFCVQAAAQGGETPIVDGRQVYRALAPAIRRVFEEKQLMYVRNFHPGVDVSWQACFRTTERAAVAAYCRQQGIAFEWWGAEGLRTRQVCPAVIVHPRRRERVWFNQIQHWHPAYLDPATRQALAAVFGPEELPRNCYYGDGTAIEESVLAAIAAAYGQWQVSFRWQPGDILMLDNLRIAHGRNPFVGERKILVAMGQMISAQAVLEGHERVNAE